jgi:hypothetical protein
MPVKVRKVPNLSLQLPLNSVRLIYQADGFHEPGEASPLQLPDLLAVSRVFSSSFSHLLVTSQAMFNFTNAF